MTNTHILILAAGRGSRMKSKQPKVLHQIAGQSMLAHVCNAGKRLNPSRMQAIVGFGADQIKDAFGSNLDYVIQEEQLGTGHAVQCAVDDINDESVVIVLYGDVPLVQPETLAAVVEQADALGLSLLSVNMDNPTGYGRIVRNDQDRVCGIVEQKDATSEQLEIKEVNTGILAAKGALLKGWLAMLSDDNAAGEFYLTDIVAMAVTDGVEVQAVQPAYDWEVSGANSRKQLAELERMYQQVLADRLLEEGVTLTDPARFDLRGSLTVGEDVFIDVNVVFEGEVALGNNVVVGSHCVIRNSEIADGSIIKPFSHIDGAVIGENTQIGPYARLREGTELGADVKIGNFVETKKTRLDAGAKASHLSYLGDAEIGANANIGAGTITCNYDGVNKHKTQIGKEVFVGSNTAIVAPVDIAAGVTIGAGSVITKSVAKDSLAIARAKQRNIEDWRK